ncbi:MAG: hypothetical protein QXL34_07100 [Thermosphaera sp.]
MKLPFANLYKRANTEKFILSRSIIVISASMLSNVFAYLFQIVSGRYLSVSDYAELVSLFSLSGILLMPITFFTGGTTKLVAEIKDINYPERISKLFITLLKFHLAFAITLTLLIVLFAKPLAWYLRIEDLNLIYIFAIALFAGNLIGFIPPFTQGLMRFKAYSLLTFLTSFTKFMTALAVMYFALQVKDIFWGLAITTILIGLSGILLLKKNIRFRNYEYDTEDFKTLFNYSLLGALGIASTVLLQNIDVIVVKHHFDEVVAGIYGSTTIIGRIIFYAASPVAIVMLPICSERYKKSLDFIKPFSFSVVISLGIAILIFAAYSLFPHLIIDLLFGEKYLGASPYLGIYGFYMVLYTLLNLLIVFFISISKFKYSSLAIIAPITEYLGLLIFNSSIMQVLTVNILSTAITIVMLLFFFGKVYKESK